MSSLCPWCLDAGQAVEMEESVLIKTWVCPICSNRLEDDSPKKIVKNPDFKPLCAMFEEDIHAVITQYSGEGLSVAELIGVLEGVKLTTYLNQIDYRRHV